MPLDKEAVFNYQPIWHLPKPRYGFQSLELDDFRKITVAYGEAGELFEGVTLTLSEAHAEYEHWDIIPGISKRMGFSLPVKDWREVLKIYLTRTQWEAISKTVDLLEADFKANLEKPDFFNPET